ncbi:MAG TPA: hypothetical protein EYG92_00450 [Lutibacter sp.]|nr:hypothetical protein [Lutibacter sp.]
MPNEAKISNAKLVKEYACPNPLTVRVKEGSTGYKQSSPQFLFLKVLYLIEYKVKASYTNR